VLIGLLKQIVPQRPDLKIVLMSATIDAGLFSEFFGDCPILYVQGRQYPVQIMYTKQPQDDYLDAVLGSVLQIHAEQKAGDILVFLTGQDEIDNMSKLIALEPEAAKGEIVVCPLYSALPQEQQMLAFEPAQNGARKIILATNIAETSITINGIRYVVDPGLAKTKEYNARIGIDSLQVKPIAQAQCRQRAGRAGREAPGVP
jgi:ATP-dependent RNA helicase DHX8/PRP22